MQMTHPAFNTSFENREMFGWSTQHTTRQVTIELTNRQWVLLASVLATGCASVDITDRGDAITIYETMSNAIFPE